MTLARRVAALERAAPWVRPPVSAVIMPWDKEPDGAGDVIRYHLVRSRGGVSERVPYERTGIHPRADAPCSHNWQLYHA